MDFSSPSPPMGSGQSPEALMEQVQAQLQQAYAEELIETLRGKCFDKCVTKPGSSLSSGESSCVSRCVDRYIEAMGIISRSLFSQQRWSALSSKLLLCCFESLSLRQTITSFGFFIRWWYNFITMLTTIISAWHFHEKFFGNQICFLMIFRFWICFVFCELFSRSINEYEMFSNDWCCVDLSVICYGSIHLLCYANCIWLCLWRSFHTEMWVF